MTPHNQDLTQAGHTAAALVHDVLHMLSGDVDVGAGVEEALRKVARIQHHLIGIQLDRRRRAQVPVPLDTLADALKGYAPAHDSRKPMAKITPGD